MCVTAGHHPRAAGGNGAPGGSVVLRATRQLTGLGSIPLHVEAERGGHGGKQWMDGKKGPDRVSVLQGCVQASQPQSCLAVPAVRAVTCAIVYLVSACMHGRLQLRVISAVCNEGVAVLPLLP